MVAVACVPIGVLVLYISRPVTPFIILAAILAFLFTLIYSIYISVDMPNISRALLELIPPPHRAEYAQLGTMVRQVWIACLRGQVVLCLVIGTATGIGTAILGLPGALLLGILAGVLEVLPTIGPILASIPAIILALLLGSPALPVSNVVFALIVALFYWIIQRVERQTSLPQATAAALGIPAGWGIITSFGQRATAGDLEVRPIPGLRRDQWLRDWPDHRGQRWADYGVKV